MRSKWSGLTDQQVPLVADRVTHSAGSMSGRTVTMARSLRTIAVDCSTVRPTPVDQHPSMRMRRPAGRSSWTQRARAAAGSGMAQSTCRERTTSNAAAGSGGSAASPTMNSASALAATALAFASAIMLIEKSIPVTSYPAEASSTDRLPVPHPRSATSAVGRGRTVQSGSRQAARTRGSRSPWSAATSNVSACSSHARTDSSITARSRQAFEPRASAGEQREIAHAGRRT